MRSIFYLLPVPEMKPTQKVVCARSVKATARQPCWPSLAGAPEAMLMEETLFMMSWLSLVLSTPRYGRQGERGGVARH